MAMLPEPLPEFIDDAYYSVYGVMEEVLDKEEILETFIERWGGLDFYSVLRALKGTYHADRLLAIFALGNLAPLDIESSLTLFFASTYPKERWASIVAMGIALGNRDEILRGKLQDLLLEELDYQGVYGDTYTDTVADAAREAEELLWSPNDWMPMLDPSVGTRYDQQCTDEADFDWFMPMRYKIVRMFGEWKDIRTLPTLQEALRICQKLQQEHTLASRPFNVLHDWNFYQNLLKQYIKRLEDIYK